MNRQQFNRYLAGENHPSAHNLHRIASFFRMASNDLFLPPEEFRRRHDDNLQSSVTTEDRTMALLGKAFPGNLRSLRSLLGFYHTYFFPLDAADTIVRGLICLFEEGGRVYSKDIERNGAVSYRNAKQRSLSKHEGLVTYLGNLIFVIEFETMTADTLSETILFPPYRTRLDVLTGMVMGVTSAKNREPFYAPIAWKYLGPITDIREALSACGSLPETDRSIDPKVRAFLKGATPQGRGGA